MADQCQCHNEYSRELHNLNIRNYCMNSSQLRKELKLQALISLSQILRKMLSNQIHACAFLLVLLAMFGCLFRFDYNIILALGWIFLSTKHPHYQLQIKFVLFVAGSILVDIFSMWLSNTQDDKAVFVFVPAIEMLLKVIIVGLAVKKQTEEVKA